MSTRATSGSTRWVLFVAIAVVGLLALSRTGMLSGGNDIVPWQADVAAAIAQAESADQPRLLYFTASWCPPCQQMRQTTFSQQSVASLLAPYVPVKVDIDQHPELATKYGISAVPTFVMLAGSSELARASGYMDERDLAEWIIRATTTR